MEALDQKLSSEMGEIKKMLMTLHRQMQESQHRRSLAEAVAAHSQQKVRVQFQLRPLIVYLAFTQPLTTSVTGCGYLYSAVIIIFRHFW